MKNRNITAVTLLVMGSCMSLVSCRKNTQESIPLILGGEEIPDDQWPAVVRVIQPNGQPCTGTFIKAGTILTAAHCTSSAPISIQGRTIREIKRLDNTGTAGPFDVAIILLEPMTNSDPMPLPLAEEKPKFGATVTLVGYGSSSIDGSSGPGIKHQGSNHLSSVDELLMVVHNETDSRASGNAGITTGDSGGPLLLDGKIIGVATGYTRYGSYRQGLYVNLTQANIRDFLRSP